MKNKVSKRQLNKTRKEFRDRHLVNKSKEITNYETVMGFFALFYLLPSLILFFVGLSDANSRYGTCHARMSKIEYIYPAYRVGCYLGKHPDE
jgi:hypothetical protein